MFTKPESDARTLFKYHHPAANTAAVCTCAAAANEVWVLDRIDWSYDTTPPNIEDLKVEINSVTVWHIEFAIPASADILRHGSVDFRNGSKGGLYGEKNQELKVTLSAAGGAIKGKLNILYR
jgi:hypothetical protein